MRNDITTTWTPAFGSVDVILPAGSWLKTAMVLLLEIGERAYWLQDRSG